MARQKETDKLTIHKTEQLDICDFDCSLKQLADIIATLRQQYGDDATLEFDYSHGYYDSVDLKVTLHWQRLETDEEVAKRIEKAHKARLAARKSREAKKKINAEKEKKDLEALIKKHPELAEQYLSAKS